MNYNKKWLKPSLKIPQNHLELEDSKVPYLCQST